MSNDREAGVSKNLPLTATLKDALAVMFDLAKENGLHSISRCDISMTKSPGHARLTFHGKVSAEAAAERDEIFFFAAPPHG